MNNKDPFLIFSERLKYLRESRDLTQKELSEDLKSYGVNITENMISLFERGITEPKLYYIDAIARYFDSSPNFMWDILKTHLMDCLLKLMLIFYLNILICLIIHQMTV